MQKTNEKRKAGAPKLNRSRQLFWQRLSDEFVPPLVRRFLPAFADTAVNEDDRKVSFTCELAGIPKKDIQVEVARKRLIVKGHCQDEACEQQGERFLTKRYRHSFRRTFSLPENIDPDKGEAKFRNGLLTITFPKRSAKLIQHVPIEGRETLAEEGPEIKQAKAA